MLEPRAPLPIITPGLLGGEGEGGWAAGRSSFLLQLMPFITVVNPLPTTVSTGVWCGRGPELAELHWPGGGPAAAGLPVGTHPEQHPEPRQHRDVGAALPLGLVKRDRSCTHPARLASIQTMSKWSESRAPVPPPLSHELPPCCPSPCHAVSCSGWAGCHQVSGTWWWCPLCPCSTPRCPPWSAASCA